jgi:hypothetical protein
MNPLTQSKNTTILPVLITVTLACLALSPQAQAVCQDGCLTNQNTVLGDDALGSNTTGSRNTAVGFNALLNSTSSTANTAVGYLALSTSNAVGFGNTAVGELAMSDNTTGMDNTAVGAQALGGNGSENVAVGVAALGSANSGSVNTAIGYFALLGNQTGTGNTAIGHGAMEANMSGFSNTAIGSGALSSNLTGSNNTATGSSALFSSRGSNNTADGYFALFINTSGHENTATGESALFVNSKGHRNTADGKGALSGNSTGSLNIGLGYLAGSALTTGSNNIAIGNVGVAAESNTIRIGTAGTQQATYVAGISGVTVAGGVGVVIDANGQLGTMTSSARYKEKIEPMGEASDKLLSLQPVKFRYKKNLDPKAIPQFGLVAEDVAKVDPDLVARDEQGKQYTVRYEAVNAMLLNEFLKEHRTMQEQNRKIQTQDATIAQLKQDFAEQQKQIEALTAGLQKVSAQIEMSRPAPQMVLNSQ